MKNTFRYLIVFCLLSGWTGVSVSAGGEWYLSSEDAQTADTTTLLAEVAVFKSIRAGISLSVAQCELTQACEPAASDVELKQLIAALDERIGGLSQRQQGSDDGAGLEDVLIAYVDELDGFKGFLDKIGSASQSVVENIDESELFGDEAAGETESTEADAAEQFGDMFADEDEEL